MVQKLSLTSAGSRFVSFWYCNYYCVIMLKCTKCLNCSRFCIMLTVEKRKEIVEQLDQKGVQAMPLDKWWRQVQCRKKVCIEEEVRCLITQSSFTVTCCGTKKVKNNYGHWHTSLLKGFFNRLNKTVGNRKLSSNLHIIT